MVDDALVRNQAVDTGAGRSHAPRVAADSDLKQAAADPPYSLGCECSDDTAAVALVLMA